MIESLENTGVPQACGTKSDGVRLGDFIFVSGQLPINTDGTMSTGDIKEQTRLCLDHVKGVLQKAGLDLRYVLQIRIYLSDISEEAAMCEVFNEVFNAPYPARSCVGVAGLQGGAKIEMEASNPNNSARVFGTLNVRIACIFLPLIWRFFSNSYLVRFPVQSNLSSFLSYSST